MISSPLGFSELETHDSATSESLGRSHLQAMLGSAVEKSVECVSEVPGIVNPSRADTVNRLEGVSQ